MLVLISSSTHIGVSDPRDLRIHRNSYSVCDFFVYCKQDRVIFIITIYLVIQDFRSDLIYVVIGPVSWFPSVRISHLTMINGKVCNDVTGTMTFFKVSPGEHENVNETNGLFLPIPLPSIIL